MILIIAFWICFGIFILLNLINSNFLERSLRGLLIFFSLVQVFLIISATILNETIFHTEFELLLGYLATSYSLWKGIFSSLKSDSNEIFRKLELIEDQTNDIPKLQDDFNDLLQISKRKK